MTPNEEIQAAVIALRSVTADATEGPWMAEDPNRQWGDDQDHRIIGGGKILATFNSDHNGPLNAMYAAAMHPGVGKALADWLEAEGQLHADDAAAQRGDGSEVLCENFPHALTVARLINEAAR